MFNKSGLSRNSVNSAHLESAQNQGKQRIEDHEDKNDEKNNEDYVCRIGEKTLDVIEKFSLFTDGGVFLCSIIYLFFHWSLLNIKAGRQADAASPLSFR